jgi:metallophosphoesterase (TIGR03767 family)
VLRGTSRRAIAAVAGLACVWAGSAVAQAANTNVSGKTTVQQTIGGTQTAGFDPIGLGAGLNYVVRNGTAQTPDPARATKRKSLIYFGQLSDFQLADEESPSRVEFLDITGTPFTAAWRPQEALGPFTVDSAIRQMNRFTGASPVQSGNGSRAHMDFAITSGDSADNQQQNEVKWTVKLLEGGTLNPNSGVEGACALAKPGEAAKYTGVQDKTDSNLIPGNAYWDPNSPSGPYAAWPKYPGLMDRAQKAFQAVGLNVPSYVAFGNHDGLAQGNQAANAAFEAIGTGCVKPITGVALGDISAAVALVPSDPARAYVSKAEYKLLHKTGHQADAHGFGYVNAALNTAAHGAIGYYSWSPKPGFRFIALDTVSEGGIAGPSADGNIDDPQFQWLTNEITAAEARNELIVLYGHHPIRSLTANVPDEAAPPCTINTKPNHDVNPGCDVDPRLSYPIHLGADLQALVNAHPHVIAYVAGHTHTNKVTQFPRSASNSWWGIETASEADWPQQMRLLQVFDNRDGTLSIFGTPLDNEAGTSIPPSGSAAAGFNETTLASISRTLSFNDPQNGPATVSSDPNDQAVELLVPDPRTP